MVAPRVGARTFGYRSVRASGRRVGAEAASTALVVLGCVAVGRGCGRRRLALPLAEGAARPSDRGAREGASGDALPRRIGAVASAARLYRQRATARIRAPRHALRAPARSAEQGVARTSRGC